jgi:hypothetical protein
MSDEKQGQFVVKGDAYCVTHGAGPGGFKGAQITQHDGSRRLSLKLYGTAAPDSERGVCMHDSATDEYLWVTHAEIGYLAKVLSEAREALDRRYPGDAYMLLSELPVGAGVGLDDPNDEIEHIAF